MGPEHKTQGHIARIQELELDHDADDDEDGAQVGGGSVLRTKNEIEEPTVLVPEISEVGADEVLEKVGEIMSIIENVVIVKGLPSEYLNRASDRALDLESLLVFEDRKVLGYVRFTKLYSTFCSHGIF